MIDIQAQDWVTYDVPEEFHVRSAENWDGWLIMQNPVWGEDGQPTGTIQKVVKDEEGNESVQTFEVHLLKKTIDPEPEGGTLAFGVAEEVGVHNDGIV